MSWHTAYFCKNCNHQISRFTMMYSSGCCPSCGILSGDTIINVTSKACRKVRIGPWWKFWSYKIEYRNER